MTPDLLRPRAVLATLLAAAASFACASAARPPEPGESRGVVPVLRGQKVMVLPFQIRQGVAGDPDAELAFALAGGSAEIEWILPDELREQLRASPSLDAPLTGLPVEIFLQAEVERLGDPVFGVLRRLGAVTGADLAILPVAVFARPAEEDREARVEASAALMSIRNGRVLWYGVEAGRGGGTDPAALAAVMDALGRRLAPRETAGRAGPGTVAPAGRGAAGRDAPGAPS